NVISANEGHGISIFSGATNNTVQGNYLGTDAAGGTAPLGNRDSGVFIATPDNLIGGTTAGARNVISGNSVGIGIQDAGTVSSTGNVVQGNYIGTDATGTLILGNTNTAIVISNSSNTVIGGTTAGAGNVISGNNFGIHISGNATLGDPTTATGNIVQGNYIGTNAAGSAPLSNNVTGLSIALTVNTLIGGTTAGAGNIIAGTFGPDPFTGDGLQILSSINTKVQGNYIGTNAAGAEGLGNARHGVAIVGSSSNVNSVVGGVEAGAANVVAFNGGDGVLIETTGTGHTVRGNSIYFNGQLGIDLGANGVTPNDAGDPDTGSNNLQNFPVILSVSTGGGSTNVQGTLNSTPNASYVIEFFANNGCDASGQGEGLFFLGQTTANTDASGNATFSATLPTQLAPGQVVTATATDANGNTSEFSVCNEVDQPGRVRFSASTYTTTETSGTAVITVVRTFGTSETASVNYATSDGSATANADYVPASGTLVFASGESMKTFTVQILDDSLGETPETVNLTLSNAAGSTLGSPSTAVLTITDNETIPNVSINSVTINEESLMNNGAFAVFTVRLSQASNNTVTVQYITADDTAQANADYTPVSGQVTFTPGQTTRPLSVRIVPDTIDEPDERFLVILTSAVNANIITPSG
ncbi:MAG TPA: Calx-beta domain-containing protein, partial [Pyrinomonadaceae bacterium]